MYADVNLQAIFTGSSEWTVWTVKWLFPSVRPDMQFEIVFRCCSVCTKGTVKGLLSSVGANVLCYMVFPDCGIFTVGALMHLADRSSPAFPRTTTDHLLGIPSLVIEITDIITLIKLIMHIRCQD